MRLGGFTAGPSGKSDWIVSDPSIDCAAMFARHDALLMGLVTYEVAKNASRVAVQLRTACEHVLCSFKEIAALME